MLLKILWTYITSEDAISQEVEEEEEKEDWSELIIYGNLPTLQTTTSIQEPRRNPPRDSRSPDKLTYYVYKVGGDAVTELHV